MTPQQALDALDRMLTAYGAPAILRRITWAGSTSTSRDVAVQALVRGYEPHQLVGGIMQGDSSAVLSPTPIIAAGWPGTAPPAGTDGRVPIIGDKLVVAGRVRNIQAAVPLYVGGELVRIELQLRG